MELQVEISALDTRKEKRKTTKKERIREVRDQLFCTRMHYHAPRMEHNKTSIVVLNFKGACSSANGAPHQDIVRNTTWKK